MKAKTERDRTQGDEGRGNLELQRRHALFATLQVRQGQALRSTTSKEESAAADPTVCLLRSWWYGAVAKALGRYQKRTKMLLETIAAAIATSTGTVSEANAVTSVEELRVPLFRGPLLSSGRRRSIVCLRHV